jgi:gliding motility-associated-like protein
VLTAAPGIYSVELTDAGGCKQFLSNLVIVADDNQPVVKIAPPVYINCDNIELYASAMGGNYFEWRKITNNNVIISIPREEDVLARGTNKSSVTNPRLSQSTEIERYTVSVWFDEAAFNARSTCFSTDVVTVVRPRPLDVRNMIADSRNVACEGETITLEAISPPAGATYQYTYQWKQDGNDIPNATARTLQVRTSGQYQVTIRIPQFNCLPVTSNTRTITINPFPVITFEGDNPVSICRGETATLRAQLESGTNYTYRWVNKTTGQQVGVDRILAVTPLATTIYVLTVTNGTAPNGCSTSKEITVNVNPVPSVDFSNQIQPFCEGNFVVLNATNPGGASYAWKRNGEVIAGQTGPTLQVGQAGDYSVTVTIGKCTATAQKTINAPLKPPVPVPPRKLIEFCFKEEPGALATADAGPGSTDLRYTWYNLNNPTVAIAPRPPLPGQQPEVVRTLPVSAGAYLVKYTNNENCVAFDTITVVDKCGPRLFVPDAFTPNGDGNNDVFTLRHPGFIRNLEFRIYNRWGEVVAVTRLQNPVPDADGSIPVWDGTFKGKASPVGSYVWTVSYESTDFPERAPIKQRGGLSLIR